MPNIQRRTSNRAQSLRRWAFGISV
jgi:hypothetical protein